MKELIMAAIVLALGGLVVEQGIIPALAHREIRQSDTLMRMAKEIHDSPNKKPGQEAAMKEFIRLANEHVATAVELDPLNTEFTSMLLEHKLIGGDFAKANMLAMRLIEHFNGDLVGWAIWHALALTSPNYDIAEMALKKALYYNNQFVESHFVLGQIYQQTKQLKKSAESLEAVVRLEPRNGHALNNLGVIYMQMGNYDKARDALLRADKAMANNPIVFDNMRKLVLSRVPVPAKLGGSE